MYDGRSTGFTYVFIYRAPARIRPATQAAVFLLDFLYDYLNP